MDNEDCNSNNTLTPDSVLCLVCQGILIKPIKLPCNHHVCLECLQRICDNSNLSCPMCRKRLSIWLRRNKDFSLLIDENLWNQIQKYYKKEVDQKLFDQDDGVWENLILNPTTHRQMYTPGELKAEYTKYIEKLEAERKQKELEEQEKSLQLIRQLEKEEEEKRKAEEAQRLLLEKQDEEYAKSLLEMETLSPPHDTPKTRSQAKALSAKRTETRSKRKSTNSADASRSKNQFGPIDVFCIRSNSPSMFSPQQPSTSRHNQQSKPAQKRKSTITGPLDSFYVRGSSANKRRCTTSSPTSSRCSSPDSIECELNYFKPIKLVPKTPPKGSDTQSQPIVVLPKFNTSPNQIDSAKQLTGTNQNTSVLSTVAKSSQPPVLSS
ncbi:hypothetical protein M8J76_016989 [Diaphorina citri]|nr:hypothetical protein M8J76_016989 [Diaphorina citri]